MFTGQLDVLSNQLLARICVVRINVGFISSLLTKAESVSTTEPLRALVIPLVMETWVHARQIILNSEDVYFETVYLFLQSLHYFFSNCLLSVVQSGNVKNSPGNK